MKGLIAAVVRDLVTLKQVILHVFVRQTNSGDWFLLNVHKKRPIKASVDCNILFVYLVF